MPDPVPSTMQAMVLQAPGKALQAVRVPVPAPGPGQVLVRVRACGICRTDLHILDGELQEPVLPLICGHQIVGQIVRNGPGVQELSPGQRVGIPWLGKTCGKCAFCRSGRENLCDQARFTGYQLPGGFAEYAVADQRFCFPVPDGYDDLQAAPLLCAGLIGYRAWRMTGDAGLVGFFGFGAAAHILIQVAAAAGRRVVAFTRPGDERSQKFALTLGAESARGTDACRDGELDAAIIFAPAGELVPLALRSVKKGGVVVCAGIHMSDIPSFSYNLLWGERSLRSVANLTRQDGTEFLQLAPAVPVQTSVTVFPLTDANEALQTLRRGDLDGAAVLQPG